MVHVLVMITAKPGMRDALLELFAANVPAVRAERGCVEYGAAFDADGFDGVQAPLGPDSFVVIEKWEDGDALRAHAAAPHMKAYGAASKELIAQRVLHVLAPA